MTEARDVIEDYISVVVHGMHGHPSAAAMTDDFYEALRAAGFAVVKEKELSILRLVATEAEEWCRCIKENGSGWDDWDSCYKTMEWELLPALKAAQGGTEP